MFCIPSPRRVAVTATDIEDDDMTAIIGVAGDETTVTGRPV
ncbi:hypothetical protein OK016_22125 [Vibrio chagasii]|nr:hypothetical protein [Vibrio chagasii]